MADQLDMQFLLMALPPAVIEAHLYLDDYQHLDFVWGINAVERVYPQVSVCTHRSVCVPTGQSVCVSNPRGLGWGQLGSGQLTPGAPG